MIRETGVWDTGFDGIGVKWANGSASSANITFRAKHDTTRSLADVSIPWSHEESIKEGSQIYLIVTNNHSTGQITIRIKYYGEILAEEIGLDPTVSAAVMGYLP